MTPVAPVSMVSNRHCAPGDEFTHLPESHRCPASILIPIHIPYAHYTNTNWYTSTE